VHITLFHHLPPQGLEEMIRMVKETVSNFPNPTSELTDIMHLEEGVAYQLNSSELLEFRQFYAESFHGLLTMQDRQIPRLHITVQNKVSSGKSKVIFQELHRVFGLDRLRLRVLRCTITLTDLGKNWSLAVSR